MIRKEWVEREKLKGIHLRLIRDKVRAGEVDRVRDELRQSAGTLGFLMARRQVPQVPPAIQAAQEALTAAEQRRDALKRQHRRRGV